MTAPTKAPSDGRAWLHPAWTALVAVIGIAVLGAIGIGVGAKDSYSRWGLENELTVPAFFSAALLVGGGLCAALAARRRLCGLYLPWLALALLLLAMVVDEAGQAHERIDGERGSTGRSSTRPWHLPEGSPGCLSSGESAALRGSC